MRPTSPGLKEVCRVRVGELGRLRRKPHRRRRQHVRDGRQCDARHESRRLRDPMEDAVRAGRACAARRGQQRRGVLGGPIVSRHRRRPRDRARRGQRVGRSGASREPIPTAAKESDRGTTRVGWQGVHRHRRQRVRNSRPHAGAGCRNGCRALAVQHGAAGHGVRRGNLEGRLVENGRRRHVEHASRWTLRLASCSCPWATRHRISSCRIGKCAAKSGTNLFTNSIVALDARSGPSRLVFPGNAVRRSRPRSGRGAHAVHPGAMVAQPLPRHRRMAICACSTAPRTGCSTRCRSRPSATRHRPVTSKGVEACPGILGGTQWNGPAYDVNARTIVVGAVDWCSFPAAGRFGRVQESDAVLRRTHDLPDESGAQWLDHGGECGHWRRALEIPCARSGGLRYHAHRGRHNVLR